MFIFKQNRSAVVIVMIVLVINLLACTTKTQVLKNNPKKDANLTWPQKPATARIQYFGKLSKPEDYGISKGLVDKIYDLVVGRQDNVLIRPISVVENNIGQLFVADPGANTVHRYDKNKRRYTAIKAKDKLKFNSPVGLASDKDGNIYIVDSELAKIFLLKTGEKEAVILDFMDDFIRPTGIAIDKLTGWIYVVDTGAHQIYVFDSDKSLLKKIGQRGSGDGEFNYPTYIWQTKAGDLLVTDSLNFRVQQFNRYGKYLGQFGKPGNATGNLSRPKGIAEDSYGHVYVVDSLFHNVQMFDSSGELLMDFGKHGTELGEFWLPVGIYVNNDNIIYLCDSYNQRVQMFKYIEISQ